ncbi:MAG: hypothetical protein EPN14_00635 [Gallionella sp.]|nr:MAG: hypothetical protein EPN14_00635 [Gallionella sp.]
MRNLLLVLLLSGCSSTQLDEMREGRSDAEIIHRAESQCMQNKYFKDASEYNACVDGAVGNNQRIRNKLAERAERARNSPSKNALSDTDNLCEKYGYSIGSPEYDECIEYAKENPVARTKK